MYAQKPSAGSIKINFALAQQNYYDDCDEIIHEADIVLPYMHLFKTEDV